MTMTRRTAVLLSVAAFVGLSASVHTQKRTEDLQTARLEIEFFDAHALYTSALTANQFECTALNTTEYNITVQLELIGCGVGQQQCKNVTVETLSPLEIGRLEMHDYAYRREVFCRIKYFGKKDALRGALTGYRNAFDGTPAPLTAATSEAR